MRRRTLASAAWIVVLGLVAAVPATLEIGGFDDAYILYSFARNFAQGHGLVWTPGAEPVYGATSVPYALLLGAASWLGLAPPRASALLGALSWALSSVVLYAIVRRRSPAWLALAAASLSAVSLRAVDHSIGMETGLYACLALLTLWLYAEGRLRACGLAAAALVLTRLDGVLVPALVIAHHALAAPGTPGARLARLARAAAPGALLLGAGWLALQIYFGSVLPHGYLAKSGFPESVSGRFSPAHYLELFTHDVRVLPPLGGILFLSLAAFGLARRLRDPRSRDLPFALWVLAYPAAFWASGLPDSPWYYAPVVPAAYALFAEGTGALVARGLADARPGRVLALAAALFGACELGLTLDDTARRIREDPFGRAYRAADDRRRLADAVREDMRRRGATSASIVAFEVGVLGYELPGPVYDLLGLVSPDVLEAEDPLYVLRRYAPDYAVIVDANAYPATGPLHQSELFQTSYREIAALPRGAHRYVAYARAPSRYAERFTLDLGGSAPPSADARVESRADGWRVTATGPRPRLVVRDLDAPALGGALLRLDLSSEGEGVMALLPDYGRGFEGARAMAFLLLPGRRQRVAARLPPGATLERLRVELPPDSRRVTLHGLALLERTGTPAP